MDINAVETGSRVTRSLRKRLTSVDNDNSSRPGTPLATKLTSITEISASPSKSTRSTRRNSISGVATPVKTPAKRGISTSFIAEDSETLLPIRSSRRRSVLTNENNEIRQTVTQISMNEELEQGDEKQIKSKSPQQENNNLTKSYSPKNTKILTEEKHKEIEVNTGTLATKKRKPGPKSKTCELGGLDGISDVEISILEDDISDAKNKSFSMETVVLANDDSNQMYNVEKEDFEEHKKDYLKSSIGADIIPTFERNTDERTGEKNAEIFIEEIISEPTNSLQFEKLKNGEQILRTKFEDKQLEIDSQDLMEKNNEHGKDNFGETHLTELEVCGIYDSSKNLDKCNTSNRKKRELPEGNNCETAEFACDKIFNDCLTPKEKETPEKVEILSVSPSTSFVCKEVKKLVDFITSPPNDTPVKTVYPKTPASIKPTVTRKILPPYSENDLFELKSCLENRDDKINEDKIAIKTDCTLEIVQSSLLACNEQETKKFNDNKIEISADRTAIEIGSSPHRDSGKCIIRNYSNKSQNQDEEKLKWINPSAKGIVAEGSKLDVVSINLNDSGNDIEDVIAENQTDRKGIAFPSDDEVEVQEDENNYYGEEYEKKNDYIVDEAMDVRNYESGDSMDSNERMEMELNEIPIDTESIGSQTTENDEDKYCEEEESVNSFIVSDNENVENFESDNKDEEIDEYVNETKSQHNKKLYRRIQRQIEDSSSSDDMEEQKLDYCGKSGSDIDCQKSIQDISSIQYEQKQKEISNSVLEEENDFEKTLNNFKCETNIDSTKLSDSSLRLYCKSEDEYKEEKTVRDLYLQVDELPSENKVVVVETNFEEQKNSSPEEDLQIEGQLVSESVTSEINKENENNSLNVSTGSCKNPKEKIICQKLFDIDVAFKDGQVDSKFLIDAKSNDLGDNLPTSNHQENKIEAGNIEYLKTIRHIPLPLGNPLIRTRRQSLALPSNPDMEICFSSHVGINSKKIGRKSLDILSNSDFKPSQSFIENIELLKNDKNRFSAKRKRLSKSFAGSTEAHDHSIVEINACYVPKRSKLMDETRLEESDQESAEQIDSKKIFTQISSTPYESLKTNESYSKRILTRCDEILEAANRAKLETKIGNKNRTKTSKKWKKKLVVTSSEQTSPVDEVLGNFSRELIRKGKTKTAISQAFMAADAILNKCKTSTLNKEHSGEKKIEPAVIEAIGSTAPIKKNYAKEVDQQKEKNENICATSAGKFMEFPQTPEKKKKIKYIQLSTGKVSVEPLTPQKKSLVQAFNGRSFRESPLFPCVVGFKVKKVNSPENNMPSTVLRKGKRQRYHDELLKNISKPNEQWTQSGLFREEVILNRNFADKKTKQRQEKKQRIVPQNFKENTLSRPDINRSTKRELLMIKKRKRAYGTINI